MHWGNSSNLLEPEVAIKSAWYDYSPGTLRGAGVGAGLSILSSSADLKTAFRGCWLTSSLAPHKPHPARKIIAVIASRRKITFTQ
jgi:hypothetical protein